MGAARPWKRIISSLARAGGSGPSRPSLEVAVERWGDLPLLRLSGELDHHAAGGLREIVQKVLLEEEGSPAETDPRPAPDPVGSPRARGLALDMDQLTYIDSGGLALLFDIARAFEEQGKGEFLGILNPNSHVLRLMEISGLRMLPAIRMILDEKASSMGEGSAVEAGDSGEAAP